MILTTRGGEDLALEAMALRDAGAREVHVKGFDADDLASHAPVLHELETQHGPIDTAVLAFGILGDQARAEADAQHAVAILHTDYVAQVSLLTLLAARMRSRGTGALVVFSSIAGARVRRANYVYGSAKAAVTAFLSGLRQRLAKSNVDVVTIKPGFVDTPMTADIAKKGALWAKPDAVAAGIVRAIDKRRSVVYLPWFWCLIMLVIKHIPEPIFKKLKL